MGYGLTPSQMARILSKRRKKTAKVCPVCEKESLMLAKQVYCTPACAQRAAYHRHAEDRRAKRRERYKKSRELQP